MPHYCYDEDSGKWIFLLDDVELEECETEEEAIKLCKKFLTN